MFSRADEMPLLAHTPYAPHSNPGHRIVNRLELFTIRATVSTDPILPQTWPPACNESFAPILAGLIKASLINQGSEYAKVDPVSLENYNGKTCYPEASASFASRSEPTALHVVIMQACMRKYARQASQERPRVYCCVRAPMIWHGQARTHAWSMLVTPAPIPS